MGFIITDLADESKSLSINAWNWVPTVTLIRKMNILDDDRAELIRYNCGVEVTMDESRKIGGILRDEILPQLQPGERMFHDGTKTNEPDDGTFYREEPLKNYSAAYEWLNIFSEFCLHCAGFNVY